MLLLPLSLLFVINFVKAETDELLVQYLEDVVSQSQAEAYIYEPPDSAYEYKPSNETITDYGTFDYIIVGAGSAGAVLATRLSEDEEVSILLVEAGGRATTFVDIAGMMPYLQKSNFNWNFRTVPQEKCCLGMVNHQCLYPRGKGLGGSTLINAVMYTHGNKYDYDSWAIAGNVGWSYRDILPYFKKSENLQGYGDYNYHGKGGLLNVEYAKSDDITLVKFLQANQEIGYKILDYNGKYELGVSPIQQNLFNGRRQHTGNAFLEKAENRPNLNILTHSYVKKVEINSKHRADSILFDYKKQSFRAHAKKEVILSAGAFGSPQLLMLSGIGPAEHLNQMGISIVRDLPVGQNLQDHVAFWALYFTTNYTAPARTLNENIRDWVKGYGPLLIAGGSGVTFIRTESSRTPEDVPNIEIILDPINRVSDFDKKILNIDDETFNLFWSPLNPKNTFRIIVILLKPKSQGSVRLSSPSPYEYPFINPKYLSDPNNEDIQALYEGIVKVLELLNTKAFKQINTKLYYKVLPECRRYSYFSKKQWFCQIRHLSSHLHHPMGTCKMGLLSNGGVVDDELKVHGIKKLRVVDASIIPEAISGHTSAPTIMIAEKIADMLKMI